MTSSISASNRGDRGKAFPQGRRRRFVQHRSVRRQVWPAGRFAGRPRSLRRHPHHRHDRFRSRRRRWRPFPPRRKSAPNDKINIIGAAGPMGTMHVIRDLCQGVPGVTVFAGDLSDERLAVLQKLAEPLARKKRAHAASVQSVQGQTRRQVRLHRPDGARAGAGGAGRPGRRAARPSSTFSPASPPTRPPRSTSTPTSKSSSTSSAPAVRCSKT